jgi:hypothetical protein
MLGFAPRSKSNSPLAAGRAPAKVMNAAFITKEDDERHIHHFPR